MKNRTNGADAFLLAAERIRRNRDEFACNAIDNVTGPQNTEREFYGRLFNVGYNRFWCSQGRDKKRPTLKEAKQYRILSLLLAREVWLSEGKE